MRKVICLIWLLGVIWTVSEAAAALEQVTVRATTKVYGAVDTRYAGFLHAITPTDPGPDRFETLKPSIIRCSEGSGYFANYRRITQAGGVFQYVLSDSFLCEKNLPTPGGPDDPTYSKWDALVSKDIAAAKAVGATTGQWDIWNEPNGCWPDQSAAGVQHFFETWRRTYNMVRTRLPKVQIVGPSMGPAGADGNRPGDGAINFNNFLRYCKQNACMPDVVTMHTMSAKAVTNCGQWLKNEFRSLGLTNPPGIAANEMIVSTEQYRPGVIPQYFANLWKVGAQYGIHACWFDVGRVPNGYNHSLDGLLAPDTKQPRSTWWVYKKYAEMSGHYVSLTGSSSVTGLASVDAARKKVMILLGRNASDSGAIDLQLRLDGLATALGFTGMLRADLWRIKNSGPNPLASPTPSSRTTMLTSDTLYLTLPNFGANDAYYVTLETPEPSTPAMASTAATNKSLKPLRKIYLSMHHATWADCVPSDTRRQQKDWESFPGRCELSYQVALKVQQRVLEVLRNAKQDEGILVVPNYLNEKSMAHMEMLKVAKEKFGPRCVVYNWQDWQDPTGFQQDLKADRRKAEQNRGPNWETPQSSPPGAEWNAWVNAKRMAVSLRMQLESQGYTFNPATVDVESFGDDWMGCEATYPIHIAGAWDLAKGVDRRFDLAVSDESLLCLKQIAVYQNLPMAENVRLFIFRTSNESPTWGRYVAQFWEGKHHVKDMPHVVTVDFPPGTAKVITVDGVPLTLALGIHPPYDLGGRIKMNVGCGGHTPHPPTMVQAEETLPLEKFRAALLAGKVSKDGLP